MIRRHPTAEHALASLKRRLAQKSKPQANGCTVWTGTRTRGYGYISFWNGERGVAHRAHRIAYALHHGLAFDFEGVVMHTCDNPACINPAHLRLGTQAENMADKKAKARNQFGSRCSYAKLDEAKVAAIRADPRPQSIIATAYGITQQTVSDICRRRIWKHVA